MSMPRTARIKSATGYYHIIARGIGKQILFEEKADNLFFLRTLKKYKQEEKFSVIAFCLMENHFHLLLKIDDGLDRVMKKISTSYASYYNTKYERTGHLFQDRYMSKPIDNAVYLLTAVRYIHNNPVKAGICLASKYKWSSWRYYTGELKGLVDTQEVHKLLGGAEGFMKYSAEVDPFTEDEGFFECRESKRLTDREAQMIIKEVLRLESGTQLQQMDRVKRDKAICKMKEEGLSIRQIERLTGITRGIVMNAKS